MNHAGHMVPTDQPEAAFNMLGHFVFNNREWKSWIMIDLMDINYFKINNKRWYEECLFIIFKLNWLRCKTFRGYNLSAKAHTESYIKPEIEQPEK